VGKLAIFICGLLLGAVGAFGAVVYQEMYKPPEKDNIAFSSKDFYDNKDYWVSISGTLTGEDMANNTYGVLCHKEQNTCFISYVEQIGSNPPQTGKIEQYTIPIVKWTNYEVIAQEDSPFACIRMTITIDRGRKALLWLEEPINQTKPNCKDARTTIRKLSIEDPPKRKAMKQSP
jgi:hypothetical protein